MLQLQLELLSPSHILIMLNLPVMSLVFIRLEHHYCVHKRVSAVLVTVLEINDGRVFCANRMNRESAFLLQYFF